MCVYLLKLHITAQSRPCHPCHSVPLALVLPRGYQGINDTSRYVCLSNCNKPGDLAMSFSPFQAMKSRLWSRVYVSLMKRDEGNTIPSLFRLFLWLLLRMEARDGTPIFHLPSVGGTCSMVWHGAVCLCSPVWPCR